MAKCVGTRVCGHGSAAVIRPIVVPTALHAPATEPAEQQAAEEIRALGAPRSAASDVSWPGLEQALNLAKRLVGDDGGMSWLVGVNPLLGVVPAHFGGVTESNIIDVDQDLIRALPVPNLSAGVSRVGQSES